VSGSDIEDDVLTRGTSVASYDQRHYQIGGHDSWSTFLFFFSFFFFERKSNLLHSRNKRPETTQRVTTIRNIHKSKKRSKALQTPVGEAKPRPTAEGSE